MVRIYQVDSFTGEPFKGNPAAVCILDGPANEGWMQSVAMEMNLSETAFLYKMEGALNAFSLRWFTPVKEVSLCGHATLASAHILRELGIIENHGELLFHTLSGEIRAWREDSLIWMDFPSDRPKSVNAPAGLLEALGIISGSKPAGLFKGASDYLVELNSADEVLNLSPDFKALKEIDSRGFIVTAGGDGGGIDFVSRFFAPRFGIDEDPVTGSAHSTLGPYWMEKLGRVELFAKQLSRRSGLISVRVVPADRSGSRDETRVHLGGRAVTIFSGEFS